MANSTKKSGLRAKNYRNFSARNLVMAKADPVMAKADPVVAKADPVVAKADPVVAKAGPVVKVAQARVVVARVRSLHAPDPTARLAAVKVVGLAVVKVAQVKAGQALVDPDKAAQARTVDLVDAAKVDAAALVDVAVSGLLIL